MKPDRPRALVLGGSGHLGRAFAGALLDSGHEVTAVARRARAPHLAGLPVRVLRADIESGDWLSREIEAHDLVIDAAAPYPLSPAAPADVVAQACRRVARVADAALEHDRPLVFIGSFSTLPRRRRTAAELFARLRRRVHPYFAVKRAMESAVLAACARGLRAVVLNPTACFGPWDDKPPSQSFVHAVLAREIPFVVREPLNVVDVRDVAQVGLRAVAEGLWGTPLLCAGHDTWTDEIAGLCADIAGLRPLAAFKAPGSLHLLSAAALGVEQACAAAGLSAPPAALGVMLLGDLGHVGPSQAMRALGVRPRPLRSTLLATVRGRA